MSSKLQEQELKEKLRKAMMKSIMSHGKKLAEN